MNQLNSNDNKRFLAGVIVNTIKKDYGINLIESERNKKTFDIDLNKSINSVIEKYSNAPFDKLKLNNLIINQLLLNITSQLDMNNIKTKELMESGGNDTTTNNKHEVVGEHLENLNINKQTVIIKNNIFNYILNSNDFQFNNYNYIMDLNTPISNIASIELNNITLYNSGYNITNYNNTFYIREKNIKITNDNNQKEIYLQEEPIEILVPSKYYLDIKEILQIIQEQLNLLTKFKSYEVKLNNDFVEINLTNKYNNAATGSLATKAIASNNNNEKKAFDIMFNQKSINKILGFELYDYNNNTSLIAPYFYNINLPEYVILDININDDIIIKEQINLDVPYKHIKYYKSDSVLNFSLNHPKESMELKTIKLNWLSSNNDYVYDFNGLNFSINFKINQYKLIHY